MVKQQNSSAPQLRFASYAYVHTYLMLSGTYYAQNYAGIINRLRPTHNFRISISALFY